MPTASDGKANALTPVANTAQGRKPARAFDKLDAAGLERILDRVRDGQTAKAIAADIGVSQSMFWAWLDRISAHDLYTRARADSAEAWAERGLAAIETCDDTNSASVNKARYLESHCRWRAGIANSRYSEKQQVELTGANGGPVQSLVTVYVPANGREERVIDAE